MLVRFGLPPNGVCTIANAAYHIGTINKGVIVKFQYLLPMAALALGGTAQAQTVSATSPQGVVAALQNAGYKATLSKDSTGDPLINSSSGGSNFSVFFFGCTRNTDCRTVQFFAGYTDRKVTLNMMNDWNSKKRFARAYMTDNGAARIEMDLDLDDGGMSAKLFEDNLEFWVAVMGAFEKHIGG